MLGHRVLSLRELTIVFLFAAPGCATSQPTAAGPSTDGWREQLERAKAAEGTELIQYDAQPNYANWGGITRLFHERYGVSIPPDLKGSSATLAALEKEKESTSADVAYYSAVVAAQAGSEGGVHQPFEPTAWDQIPDDCKDPEGRWFCVHQGVIGFVVNTDALERAGVPVPKCWSDLVDPRYKGLVAYDDPTVHGTAWEVMFAANLAMGGSATNLRPGVDYLKKLAANISSYSEKTSYEPALKGELGIWLNADSNGYRMKWEEHAPIEVVIPCEGTSTTALAMGMVKWSKHPQLARAYLNWLLGPEAQGLWATSYWRPIIERYLTGEAEQRMKPLYGSYDKVKTVPILEKKKAVETYKEAWRREVVGQTP